MQTENYIHSQFNKIYNNGLSYPNWKEFNKLSPKEQEDFSKSLFNPPKDIQGNPISIGDTVAIAVTQYKDTYLTIGKVTDINWKTGIEIEEIAKTRSVEIGKKRRYARPDKMCVIEKYNLTNTQTVV